MNCFSNKVNRLHFGLAGLLLLGLTKACWSEPALLRLRPVVSGLTEPVQVTSTKATPHFIYVIEQAGRVQQFHLKTRQQSLFMDMTHLVESGGEKGLLSLAFHPLYAQNGRVFVNYTRRINGQLMTVVSEFRGGTRGINPSTERVLLRQPQPYDNHNGGQIAFGPDGYLYIGFGDGGSRGDPHRHAQNRSNWLGAILRINVNSGKPYALPTDNPFLKNADIKPEIWAYGLRNPWRFSFDRQLGLLYAGDVGQDRYEEIDLIQRGGNYGWNIMEGRHCYAPSQGCTAKGLILPLIEYPRNQGISVTGGFVYRGTKYPRWQGTYFYGDFGSGRIWGLKYSNGKVIENRLWLKSALNISAFGEDHQGELYVIDYGSGQVMQFEQP